MKVVCAPASFKETLHATEVAQAMAAGLTRAATAWQRHIEIDLCPIGDGGEGTMEALVHALAGGFHTHQVTGPLGMSISARFGHVTKTHFCIVELAEAAGLALVPHHQRDPEHTTTFGVGELIGHAIDAGARELLVCIGGSATIDGGTGIAQALGAKFWDRDRRLIQPPRHMCGALLVEIARYEPPPPDRLPPIRVACDVTNPLCGPNGAAAVYGPQKGARPQQVQELDVGLRHLATLVGGDFTAPGTGAAGGAAFGLMAMCGATLHRGIDLVLDRVGFDERCRDADFVLTGEGRLDHQSFHGKACQGVAARAARLGIPTLAIVGSTGDGAADCVHPSPSGFLDRCISLSERFGTQRARQETAALIEQSTFALIGNLHP